MKLNFNIAVRFLKSNISQTLIIILGIGIGISVQIFIGSLIQGLQKGLVEKTIGSSSQITITSKSEDKLIYNYSDLMGTLLMADSRVKAYLPVYDNAALMGYKGKSQSLLVRGLDFSKADDIYKISSSIVEGSMPKNSGEVILGKNLIEEYGFHVGDNIDIISPDKTTRKCKITGFFDLKVAQINNSWCITSLSSAQEIFNVQDVITSMEMQVKEEDVFSTDLIAENISSTIGKDNYKIIDWKKQNEQLLSGLQGQSISSLMIQIFVMLSVILGIASVLAITVMQKSKQIGILKAMGIKNSSASMIFLFEGLILGVLGTLVGILLGVGLSVVFTTFALNPDKTPIVDLYIDKNFVALSGFIAILSCIIASFIPASKSSKLNPIDIIRNN